MIIKRRRTNDPNQPSNHPPHSCTVDSRRMCASWKWMIHWNHPRGHQGHQGVGRRVATRNKEIYWRIVTQCFNLHRWATPRTIKMIRSRGTRRRLIMYDMYKYFFLGDQLDHRWGWKEGGSIDKIVEETCLPKEGRWEGHVCGWRWENVTLILLYSCRYLKFNDGHTELGRSTHLLKIKKELSEKQFTFEEIIMMRVQMKKS